jgi:hypothetical protein
VQTLSVWIIRLIDQFEFAIAPLSNREGPSVNAWQQIPRSSSSVVKLLQWKCTWHLRVPALTRTGFDQALGELRCRHRREGVWMLPFLPSHPVRRAHIESYHRVRKGVGAEDLHKFIMNHVSWKSLPVKRETNRAWIHCAVRWVLMLNSIFSTMKSLLLDHKTKYKDFVFGKYVHIAWAIRGSD